MNDINMYNNIGFIGYGNMGMALGEAIVSNSKYNVYFYDLNNDKNDFCAKRLTKDELISKCEVIFLAIKPYQYEDFLKENNLTNKLVISIAAGITSEFMSKYCTKFVLTMPNTPSLVQEGVSAIVKNSDLSDSDNEFLEDLFKIVGKVMWIKEEDLSKSIILSGSSPAYFFHFIDSLTEIFVNEYNFNKEEAEYILAHVMKGAAEMIIQNNLDAKQLTKNVCSPNGTTIEAINVFKESELSNIFSKAINKCYLRAIELEKQS